MQHFQLIIIGGGIMGTAHAYHALRLGLRVALIEKNTMPQGATVRNFGQVVPSGMTGEWQAYGRRSLDIYKELEDQFGITARNNGTVYLASNAEEMTLLEELAAINTANDYPSQLWNAEACLDRYQGLKPEYCKGGLFFPEEITLEPRTAVYRILNWLQEQMGLIYFPNTLVSGIMPFAGGCLVECSDRRSFQCEQTLICSGSDFKNLFPETFYQSDIDVCKLQMLETEAQQGQQIPGSILTGLSIRRYESFSECPSWSRIKAVEDTQSLEKQWGVHILFKQTLENTVIIGDTHEYAPAREADTLGFDIRTDMNDFMLEKAREIFDLNSWAIRRSWIGFYCQCREQDYFSSTIDGRIHLLTGIGGKGMTASFGFAEQHIRRILQMEQHNHHVTAPRTPPVEMVVFDMAGTTIDEDNVVYKTVWKAVNNAGIVADYPSVLQIAAGKEKLKAIEDVINAFAPDRLQEAPVIFEQFGRELQQVYQKGEFKSQPGAESVFKTLKDNNIRVVLNTGYSREVADLLLNTLGWHNHPHIDLTLTADDVQQGRPHPEMIHKAMAHFGINTPVAVVKIGDSAIDILEGKNAGCGYNFGITTGAHNKEQLLEAQPDAVFSSLSELPVWLNEHTGVRLTLS